MKKVNTSPISGTQELTPENQAIFNNLKTKIDEVYHRHGYLDIETPSIERTEILLAKAGGDTEKQIYKVVKTAETADESDQALRFDHTVPLARYIVEHENNLVFPFKVSQIGLNFRGERAQKGRFREFYQCDIDVIGRNNLPLAYDADVISTLLQTFKSFNLKTPVLARINNRKILTGLLEALNLTESSTDIYGIIDHAEKVPVEKTTENLTEIGISEENTKKILAFMNLHGERSFVIKNLSNLNIGNPTFLEGVAELDQTLYLLETMGLKNQIAADMKIVRGLDYYTGTVFEFILPEYKNIGSVCGGGRYENLTGYFTDQKFPGVGGSIGLTRLFYVLNEGKLLPEQPAQVLDYAIVPISENELDFAFSTAAKLRQQNYSVTVVLTDKKLGDKLTYAAKLAKNGIVIGESEVASGKLQVKDFSTGETNDLDLNA
ncbi:histidine--tRNA ligase [Candidatus Nanosyncoccus alces]|uniref:Histidine--tRNA ligase n=1 Tax=Candidatus Nanosyncoccus alces TaxID=2171997 RepID=A0ABY0FMJ5_9BACT|nr:histidine--tRNA ligase [Candidatus Nanosyncoccus alces]RYC75144.1 Histidine--tRNA ligase [Candidatus Nanosyncoccus alces]